MAFSPELQKQIEALLIKGERLRLSIKRLRRKSLNVSTGALDRSAPYCPYCLKNSCECSELDVLPDAGDC